MPQIPMKTPDPVDASGRTAEESRNEMEFQKLVAKVRETPLLERLKQCKHIVSVVVTTGRKLKTSIPVQATDEDFLLIATLEDAHDAIRLGDEFDAGGKDDFEEGDEQGWGNPNPEKNNSKWHYFDTTGRSLCKAYRRINDYPELEDSNHEHEKNCSTCRKRLEKLTESVRAKLMERPPTRLICNKKI